MPNLLSRFYMVIKMKRKRDNKVKEDKKIVCPLRGSHRSVPCYEERILESIGIEEGPVKGDIVLSDDNVYIYEISNRFHGDVSTSHLYTFCRSVSPIELYMQTLYQQKEVYNRDMPTPNNICGWYVLNFKLGKIKGIEGLDKAGNIKGVKKILLNKKVGDTINPLKDNTDVPGFVWICGKTRKDIHEKYNKVMETIMIEYE